MTELLMSLWLLVAPLWTAPKVPLSLTPIQQEAVVREDLRIVCPKSRHPVFIRDAPRPCLVIAMEEMTQRLERMNQRLKRLHQQLEQRQQRRK